MKTYLIDLDGTMYKGNTIIDGALDFLQRIREHGDRYLFLTNNATRTGKQNVEHMEKLGFYGLNPEDFFTSSMAAARYIAKKSSKRNAFFVGKDGLREALLDSGFTITDKDVDFVFVGLDKDGSYQTYSYALKFLLNGAKLVGTNSDRLLAKDDGFNIGNGSIVAMFEYATGQESEKIGKPYQPILDEVLEYASITKEEAILVGDNLETEIKLGVDFGVKTIFVTSGVHDRKDIERLKIIPNQVVNSLNDIEM
ncbi:4-nitrophenyl phosphatase [Breznakia sp. PF5-3]|uniref:HAD-IIA family hydrolase n=1 Tax=unclassified Breznakia TaxID=2623764 RepID=UPI0024058367|nr:MULTISPECIES: HAD-IIA family hydrolase [unclassified Breznakia]MDF9823717.1 4-nitrophenyl phosphatase [Breznakia sp. PM6-1]MDF9834515.1 4-nitrophenyl phosphatase [Breznakia sp. PF5-3]MDF9837514.1 4-nitrophenyl phosphatase [Breznakia sp. PFB2-8]MDF9859091.1 4-nitrophenyl phosphatase [Breznakia sp. PH5-24]